MCKCAVCVDVWIWGPCMHDCLCVLVRRCFCIFGGHVSGFIASPWCYLLHLHSLHATSSRNGHVAQMLPWGAIIMLALTLICIYRPQVPLTTKKKKRKKRSPTKPIGAIPEDVLNRAKELAGDYQKLSKLLRKKAFREVGELNKPCKCQCRCGV